MSGLLPEFIICDKGQGTPKFLVNITAMKTIDVSLTKKDFFIFCPISGARMIARVVDAGIYKEVLNKLAK